MYNNMEDLPPEYEKDLNILENQITELFTLLEKKEIQLYQLKDENEELRTRIKKLQQQLNPPQQQLSPPQQQLNPPQQQLSPPQPINQQIDTIRVPNQQISLATSPSTIVSTNKRKCPNPPQQQLNPPQPTNQQMDTIRVPNQQISLTTSPSTIVSTNKRKCPKCGAMGFAIKEVNDKTRLISYVPRRIYAKKRVCTKCRYEF
jgi:regulator of replication initiation timing/predicted nucleic-acid-binding Zn-ribbon protein